ncbi:MAG TPA: hypothetical protein VF789_08470 [Thermoanaerobaculia bacterium]
MPMLDVQACLERSFIPAIPGLQAAEADAPDFLGRMKGALLLGDNDSTEELSEFLTLNGLWESALPILRDLEAGGHQYAHVFLDELHDRNHVTDWARIALRRSP